jgi:hypothetical protein
MSAAKVAEDLPASIDIRHRSFHEFGPEYLTDADDDPDEVTIYSDDEERLAVEWVTCDIESAIPQEEWR